MYQYDEYDRRIVEERAKQFGGQVERRLSGEIKEIEFKPLRLQNGLYMQLHAYMLRVAIPYGTLSSKQLRMLAHIARKYDKGYGHFTTRQNIQYNWPQLEDVPRILEDLASVEMHAIQTSGNCIRNITSDHFAGVARDELEDPRPWGELMRQWSTFHPEFAALPRKFKVAISATPGLDRAAVAFHDIGVRVVENEKGERGFEVLAGGGMGRTPFVGPVIGRFVQRYDLLSYLEAILRVYNTYGRRDNAFKARIKILVNALGVDEFRARVEEEWQYIKDGPLKLTESEIERVAKQFTPPTYLQLEAADAQLGMFKLSKDRDFGRFVQNNTMLHKQPGYVSVVISLKEKGTPPGDMTDVQMECVADLADRFGFGELRVTHTQNLILPDVQVSQLPALYQELAAQGLATANANKITDVIACPGLDYCSLANARSIPVALEIMDRFEDIDYQNDLGELQVKISGCINACGHHHVGHIGILGIDKQGEEFYQLQLGGSAGHDASIGQVLGKAFPRTEIVPAVEKVLALYLKLRSSPEERLLDVVRRLGIAPFKEMLYPPPAQKGAVHADH
ncbi:MAG TPA: nitrite/sulfite reductase [Polyangiales bacterium]|nr:nitrite/sulfite reductase [Polyangiales bacterium]